jgi:hypothetical protein
MGEQQPEGLTSAHGYTAMDISHLNLAKLPG